MVITCNLCGDSRVVSASGLCALCDICIVPELVAAMKAFAQAGYSMARVLEWDKEGIQYDRGWALTAYQLWREWGKGYCTRCDGVQSAVQFGICGKCAQAEADWEG